MPPPPSFLSVAAFPYSRVITQAEFNGGTFGGVANEVWFQFITATQIAFGGFVTKGGTFNGSSAVFASDGTTLLHNINGSALGARSYYFVFATGTYYIRVRRFGGGPSDFDFTATFDIRSILTSVASGNLIINDDTQGFPAVVMERTTGNILGVLPQIPAGETAANFNTGESIWHHAQAPGRGLSIFDAAINLLVSGINDQSSNEAALCNSDVDFYFFYGNAIDKITKTGTITTTALGTAIPQINIKAVQMNADGTRLFYITGGNIASGFNTGIIKRWDVIGNSALPDFYSIPGFVNVDGDQMGMTGNNGDNGNLLRLTDGTFVTHSYDGSSDLFSLLHLSSAGILLHKYDYPGYGSTAYGIIDHLCHNIDDPVSVIVWFYKDSSGEQARYASVDLSTGTLSVIEDTDMFSQGINLHANSPIIFAPSNSCVPMLYLTEIPPAPPNPGSGIYKVVPGKHNDTLWDEDFAGEHSVKIPNPFAKSGLLGE